jgi:hypothetical protein
MRRPDPLRFARRQITKPILIIMVFMAITPIKSNANKKAISREVAFLRALKSPAMQGFCLQG